MWSSTWADLDEKLAVDSTQEVPELAVPDPAELKTTLRRMGLAEHAALPGQPVFRWFEAELTSDGLPWRKLAEAVLAARMRRGQYADTDRWVRFVDRVAPPVARSGLAAMAAKLFSKDQAETNRFFELMAVHDGSEPALLCTLDDREENLDAPELKAAWHGTLRLYQLLRKAPNAWFMTHSTACHQDVHRGELDRYLRPTTEDPAGCTSCHGLSHWRAITFEHDRSEYPLTGRHREVECGKCHPRAAEGSDAGRMRITGVATACAGCHRDPHAGQFDRAGEDATCESCHTVFDWRASGFDHQRDSTYRLDGAHARVPCLSCHYTEGDGSGTTWVRYRPLTTACADCHGGRKP